GGLPVSGRSVVPRQCWPRFLESGTGNLLWPKHADGRGGSGPGLNEQHDQERLDPGEHPPLHSLVRRTPPGSYLPVRSTMERSGATGPHRFRLPDRCADLSSGEYGDTAHTFERCHGMATSLPDGTSELHIRRALSPDVDGTSRRLLR